MKTTPSLSIVIPVYNGAGSLPTLLGALNGLAVPGGMEIILVNDGSPDDSLVVCKQLASQSPTPVTVVNLSRNYGEHNAVMAGLAQAQGDYIITMDDDLQNPPEEVIKLLEHARHGGFDVVYSRYSHKEHAAWRNWGSRLANRCADILLDKPRGLYLSSFRCMNAFTARAILAHTGPFPYIDGLIMQVTQNIGCVEVRHLPRTEGKSGYTLKRLVRLFLSMMLNFSITPLHLTTLVGITMAILGMIGIAGVITEWMVTKVHSAGWASLMATLLLVGGVQLTMLGVIGEYLGRLFLTANGKPQYIVREITSNRPTSPGD